MKSPFSFEYKKDKGGDQGSDAYSQTDRLRSSYSDSEAPVWLLVP